MNASIVHLDTEVIHGKFGRVQYNLCLDRRRMFNRQGIENLLKWTVYFVCRENLYTPDGKDGVS